MEKTIYQRMIEVMRDIEAVGKDRVNKFQNYNFRGIDDFLNVLHDVMARHGVFVLTDVISSETQFMKNDKGKHEAYCIMKVKHTFTAADGSTCSTTTEGHGKDSGDKAGNKAHSAAMKYALLQTFLIPTEEKKDSEYDSPKLTAPISYPSKPTSGAASYPKQSQRQPTAPTTTPAASQSSNAGSPPLPSLLVEGKLPYDMQHPETKAKFAKGTQLVEIPRYFLQWVQNQATTDKAKNIFQLAIDQRGQNKVAELGNLSFSQITKELNRAAKDSENVADPEKRQYLIDGLLAITPGIIASTGVGALEYSLRNIEGIQGQRWKRTDKEEVGLANLRDMVEMELDNRKVNR